ncbi:MAG TPA: FAD-binding oxidoreductase [Acidobacteriota bacterium]|nr:FAD-binding oxidoreductase [Acidobacteriota bacterium]
MTLPKTADVVIIGGGVMGGSIAYHLATRGSGNIVLLEKEQFLGAGATGRSSGGVRHQFSNPTNVRLSIESIRRIEEFQKEIGAAIDFHQDGYLFLLTSQSDRVAFENSVTMQRSFGLPSDFLSHEEIERLVPHLNLHDVLAATFCPKDGIADPNGITLGYAAAARKLGAQILTEVEVTGFKLIGGRPEASESRAIQTVHTTSGDISGGVVVNAAGPWARRIGEFAGVDLPVFPYRRHVFTTHPLAGIPNGWTMVIDFATSFYFHREGDGLLFGMSDPNEPSSWRQSVDWGFLDRVIEVGIRRYPLLENASIHRAWTGLYEVTPDANPILGRTREVTNLVLANGFSGHGFMHGPAVGKVIAEIILDGEASTVDVSEFSIERFRGKILKPERNVI